MSFMEHTVHTYRVALHRPGRWSRSLTAWFIVASCSAFWGSVAVMVSRAL